jgi:hypothetical protein
MRRREFITLLGGASLLFIHFMLGNAAVARLCGLSTEAEVRAEQSATQDTAPNAAARSTFGMRSTV